VYFREELLHAALVLVGWEIVPQAFCNLVESFSLPTQEMPRAKYTPIPVLWKLQHMCRLLIIPFAEIHPFAVKQLPIKLLH
jgi:hypothetical protein